MKRHILIIDDDQSILEAVQAVLELAGYEVLVLKEAHQVFDQLRQLPPDLVLLDLLLSGADGRDIAKKIKSDPDLQHIPIILMSADTHIKEKSAEARADNYLKKPFDIDELETLVKQYAPLS